MENNLWWFLLLGLNFGLILFIYRRLGELGLYIWVPISIIVANIQVTKTIDVLGVTATLGNIVYATSFLATDILSENYGKKRATKAVEIGFFALITMMILMTVAIKFIPGEADFAQESLTTIFGIMPRIALGSLVAYWISQRHDIWAYDFWRKKFPDKKWIVLRNNLSTMISQGIDSVVFSLIAFWGVFPLPVVGEIILTTYLIKWLVAALDTPLVYLASKWKEKGSIKEW